LFRISFRLDDTVVIISRLVLVLMLHNFIGSMNYIF